MKVVTLIIAVWGALLSTLLALDKLRQSRRRLRVIANMIPAQFGNGPVIDLRIVNIGVPTVVVADVGFTAPGGRKIDIPLARKALPPYSLESGAEEGTSIMGEDISHILIALGLRGTVKIRPYVRDTLDTYFKTKRIHFEVDNSCEERGASADMRDEISALL